jgi:PIN domain nuclease of toxin-antitoxin system
MSALLLDTNAIIWFMARERMRPEALASIAAAQEAATILVSPISAWEAALALRKRHSPPDLGGRDAAQWFRAVLKVPGVRLANLTQRIALEAARVPAFFGRGDPADCFLIATARVRQVPIVTRDRGMRRLADSDPSYLQVIIC